MVQLRTITKWILNSVIWLITIIAIIGFFRNKVSSCLQVIMWIAEKYAEWIFGQLLTDQVLPLIKNWHSRFVVGSGYKKLPAFSETETGVRYQVQPVALLNQDQYNLDKEPTEDAELVEVIIEKLI